MINRTHLEHGVIAVIIQLVLAYPLGWWAAGHIAVAVFAAREYAQVEYKLVGRGMPLTDLMPWHVLRPSLWSADGIIDIAAPAFFVYSLAYLVDKI